MAQVWSTFLDFPAGSTTMQRASLGPSTRPGPGHLEQVGESVPAVVGTVRVGFAGGEYPAELFRCDLSLPDQGTLIEGIDVPLVVAVPLAGQVFVRPLTAPAVGLRMCVSASELQELHSRAGATRTDPVPGGGAAGGVVLLAPWCEAVSLHDPAAIGEWIDAAAASLGFFNGYAPRPRQAVSVATDQPSLLTQHYSS